MSLFSLFATFNISVIRSLNTSIDELGIRYNTPMMISDEVWKNLFANFNKQTFQFRVKMFQLISIFVWGISIFASFRSDLTSKSVLSITTTLAMMHSKGTSGMRQLQYIWMIMLVFNAIPTSRQVVKEIVRNHKLSFKLNEGCFVFTLLVSIFYTLLWCALKPHEFTF